MKRLCTSVGVVLAFLPTASPGAEPWHHPLCLHRGGYWRTRIPVAVTNTSDSKIEGRPIEVLVGRGVNGIDLAGEQAEAVRVCDAAGAELLFDLAGGNGEHKREGTLAAGDRLAFAVDCSEGETSRYWVYFDNPNAMPVPDFLRTGLVNPGFEAGADMPSGWRARNADDKHRTYWVSERPQSGNRCSKTVVDAGAEPSWITTTQRDIQVLPGRQYVMRAWVRGENVRGNAGWYIHVNGRNKPQLISRVLRGGEGTFDWRQITFTFTAPDEATHANLGTILRGTGTAWYDDVNLERVGEDAECRISVGTGEAMSLVEDRPSDAWRLDASKWPCRVAVRALNFKARPRNGIAIRADATRGIILAKRYTGFGGMRVVDPADGGIIAHHHINSGVIFMGDVPAKSSKAFHVYFSPDAAAGAAPTTIAALVRGAGNLAKNGDFETGGHAPSPWRPYGETSKESAAETNVASGGIMGDRCVRVHIPPTCPLAWRGWSQYKVPVSPNTRYLYAGYLKTRGIADGRVQLCGHFKTADGKNASTWSFGAGPPLTGDHEWTLCSRIVRAPGDCSYANLHLTMRAHGTAMHDGVLLCEIEEAETEEFELAPHLRPKPRSYHVWPVNPLVKVLPDDPPGEPIRAVRTWAARNEYEPFQFVVRPAKPLRDFGIEVTPLVNAEGRSLPAVDVTRVDYVYVDHGGSFHRSDVPDWYRKMPNRPSRADGWAGEWPDPMPTFRKSDLPPDRNVPVWLTVRVSPDAAPGEYRGTMTLRAANAATTPLPVIVTVWPFSLPKVSRLKVIFDLRAGAFGKVFGGPDPKKRLRTWYRMLADHRISPGILQPHPKFTYKDGKVGMDTAEFDEMASYCFDELGMNVMYTPWVFYAFGWAYKPRPFLRLEAFTPEHREAWTEAYRLFGNHLKARGWYDKFVYYISDEPHFRHEFVVEQMKTFCDLAHAADPNMPIYSSTLRHEPRWNGYLDIWGVGQYGCFPLDEMKRRLEAGEKLWFTTDGQHVTTTPYLGTHRLWPYYCFKYDVEGYENWGVSWWSYDPWRFGWHSFIRQSMEGEDFFWTRYPNGTGFLTYPGDAVGQGAPVTSIRFEHVREGIEDYEYFAILSDLIAEARKSGVPTGGARSTLDAVRALVDVPNPGGFRSTDIMPEPDAIPKVRRAVAEQIVALRRALGKAAR